MASDQLKFEIDKALANTTLARTLGNFCAAYPEGRANSYKGVDFEHERNGVKEVKTYAAEHIDEMIDNFKANAEARGAVVHVAKDKTDAIEWVRGIVKENNVKTIVKSKSMASEEIHMNKILGEDGVLVQETDLGEFIIALEGNTPVHMVMPALHLNKEQVADLFTDYTKEKNEPIIAEEVKTARKVMRQKFQTAEMGVSGANIAVADTGTVFTMTNEGNGRMVATLPKIHLYVFGIEKFVKSVGDARYVFKVLPRNGTKQRLTAYLSLYTGATEVVTDKEADTIEKKKFYILILDDEGRREILAQPDFREIYNCVRCGACLDVCPAFALVGGHVFGSNVYTGGIGTMLTHFLINPDRADEIQNICLQCGRCNEVCGGGLDIKGMIMKLRRESVKKNPGKITKFAFDAVNDRHLFHSMLRIASVAQDIVLDKDAQRIRHLPLFLSGMTDGKSFPSIARVPCRDIFPTIKQDVPNPKGKIALFAGCLLDFVYTDLALAVIKDFNSIGYIVDMPMEQGCCGCPAESLGDTEAAAISAEMNTAALHVDDYDYIVSACPSCTHQLHLYADRIPEGSDLHRQAEAIKEKTMDFAKLFYQLDGAQKLGDGKPVKVTYHDSCHMKREMGVYKEQRELLVNTNGVELVEMNECDNCCGFGGAYMAIFPEISKEILEKKMKNIAATGAEVVAVDCPGCMMQIEGGADARGMNVDVKHTATIIAEKRGLL